MKKVKLVNIDKEMFEKKRKESCIGCSFMQEGMDKIFYVCESFLTDKNKHKCSVRLM